MAVASFMIWHSLPESNSNSGFCGAGAAAAACPIRPGRCQQARVQSEAQVTKALKR
jgi:hypothetical protein